MLLFFNKKIHFMKLPFKFHQAGLLVAIFCTTLLTNCKKDDEATPQTVTDVVIADDRFTLG
jgi:hypothetical protein